MCLLVVLAIVIKRCVSFLSDENSESDLMRIVKAI